MQRSTAPSTRYQRAISRKSASFKLKNTLLAKLQTFSKIEHIDTTLACTVTGNIREFLSAVSLLDVSGFHEQSLSLEEIFMHYYRSGGMTIGARIIGREEDSGTLELLLSRPLPYTGLARSHGLAKRILWQADIPL